MNGGASTFPGWPIALALVATAAWLLSVLGRTDPLLGLPDAQAALDVVTTVAASIAAVLLLARLVLGLLEADRRTAD
jgi:hypothetical protein